MFVVRLLSSWRLSSFCQAQLNASLWKWKAALVEWCLRSSISLKKNAHGSEVILGPTIPAVVCAGETIVSVRWRDELGLAAELRLQGLGAWAEAAKCPGMVSGPDLMSLLLNKPGCVIFPSHKGKAERHGSDHIHFSKSFSLQIWRPNPIYEMGTGPNTIWDSPNWPG